MTETNSYSYDESDNNNSLEELPEEKLVEITGSIIVLFMYKASFSIFCGLLFGINFTIIFFILSLL